MARRTTGPRVVATLATGALVLAACTAQGPTPTPTPTPTPPPVHQGEARVPDGPATVLPDPTEAALAVGASQAFFASAPVVVVSAPDPAQRLRAASIAVALGAPLLMDPTSRGIPDEPVDPPADDGVAGAPDPAAPDPADPAPEPGAADGAAEDPVDEGADATAAEVRRLGALAVVTVGDVLADLPPDVDVVPAPDDDDALADLLRVALGTRTLEDPGAEVAAVGELDREAPALLVVGPPDAEPADPGAGSTHPDAGPTSTPEASGPADGTQPPDAEPADPTTDPTADADPTALPLTELPEAPDGGLLLTTGDPAELAAVATARAAGVDVVLVPSGDPRATSATVQAVAAAGASSVVGAGAAFGTAEDLAWQAATAATGVELPGGGQVHFPGRRYVAMYGSPDIPALGILGEQDVAASVERAQALAAEYQALTGDVVVPAFEIIATIADRPAGDDGNYSNELPPERFAPWIEAAQEAGVYVVLDLQPGRTDFVTQARLYEELLRYPNVGLALDPEWRLGPNQVHLRQIGSVHVDEVNAVVAYLSELTREHHLPQKLLVLHQFMQRMIVDRARVTTTDPAVQVLVHVDGQGSQGAKAGTWANILSGAPPGVVWGWKNFIDEDVPMATPEQTYRVQPTPHFVSYQ